MVLAQSLDRKMEQQLERRIGEIILGIQLNILMRLSSIENHLKEHGAMLSNILSSMPGTVDNTDDLIPEPLETEEELAALCEKLTEKTYRKRMIMFLSCLGGGEIAETIRRMMRKIGTNKLWSGYNLKGRKKKKNFENLTICGAVKRAYLRTHPKADEKSIENQISAVLKQAPFQKGGVHTKVSVSAAAFGSDSETEEFNTGVNSTI